jgi:hypothetical protein
LLENLNSNSISPELYTAFKNTIQLNDGSSGILSVNILDNLKILNIPADSTAANREKIIAACNNQLEQQNMSIPIPKFERLMAEKILKTSFLNLMRGKVIRPFTYFELHTILMEIVF